jgi:hypothetical protein
MLIKLTKNTQIASKDTESFHTKRKLKGDYYHVSVYKTMADLLFVSAFNEKSSEMFLIELPKKKSAEVLTTFSKDLAQLCDNLDIQNNRLVILNPNRKNKKVKSTDSPQKQHAVIASMSEAREIEYATPGSAVDIEENNEE